MSTDKSADNRRIVRNTLFLYLRMGLSMGISLFTSRVVLQVLGVMDYGLWNVVGGVIGLFAFLNISMTGCTNRFITYELGHGDEASLQRVFSAATTIHLLIAALVLLLGETVGLWFLEYKLVIPPERMLACRILYQLSIMGAVISVTQVPYSASIMAHERMHIYAYFELFNVVLKLAIVYLLLVSPFDRLISYAILSFVVSVITRLFYRVYCVRRLPACRFSLSRDWQLMRPMLSFSGYDLWGNASVVARTQGINILFNLFFSATMNAACAVANQVQNAVMSFGRNVMTAYRPQIVRSYASGDAGRSCQLIYKGSMYVTILMLLIVIPLEVEMDYVLQLWLKNPPAYSAAFARLVLLYYLIGNLPDTVQMGIHATGRIRELSLVTGTLFLLVVPVTYLLFRMGCAPYWPYIINIGFIVLSLCYVSWLLHRLLPQFSPRRLLLGVAAPLALVGTAAYLVGRWVAAQSDPSFLRLLLVALATTLVTSALSLVWVLDESDRQSVGRKARRLFTGRSHTAQSRCD